MYKYWKSYKKKIAVQTELSFSTRISKLKPPWKWEEARPISLLLKSTPAETYAIWTSIRHWLTSISLLQPYLSFILAIKHQESTKLVNYFYLSFISLQTHKMKFETLKTKYIISNIGLKRFKRIPKVILLHL